MFTKKFRYRNIDFVIQKHPSLYGHYIVECDYRRKHIKFVTTNARVFDHCDDDEHKALRKWARQWIMHTLKEQYEAFYLF